MDPRPSSIYFPSLLHLFIKADTYGEHEDVVEKVVDNAEDHPFGAEEHIDQRISDETGVGEYAHVYRTKKPTSVLDEKF